MIQQVNDLRQKKRKKKVWTNYAKVAACLCIFLTGVALLFGSEMSKEHIPASKITVYAKEKNAGNMTKLTKESAIIAEYSPLSSSIPALMFHIEYPKQDVKYRISVSGEGELLKYEVSEDGIWSVVAQGKKMVYKKGEDIYFNLPYNMSKQTQIAIEILEDNKIIDNRNVLVEENKKKNGFVARIVD